MASQAGVTLISTFFLLRTLRTADDEVVVPDGPGINSVRAADMRFCVCSQVAAADEFVVLTAPASTLKIKAAIGGFSVAAILREASRGGEFLISPDSQAETDRLLFGAAILREASRGGEFLISPDSQTETDRLLFGAWGLAGPISALDSWEAPVVASIPRKVVPSSKFSNGVCADGVECSAIMRCSSRRHAVRQKDLRKVPQRLEQRGHGDAGCRFGGLGDGFTGCEEPCGSLPSAPCWRWSQASNGRAVTHTWHWAFAHTTCLSVCRMCACRASDGQAVGRMQRTADCSPDGGAAGWMRSTSGRRTDRPAAPAAGG
jgi:hypothetical protein